MPRDVIKAVVHLPAAFMPEPELAADSVDVLRLQQQLEQLQESSQQQRVAEPAAEPSALVSRLSRRRFIQNIVLNSAFTILAASLSMASPISAAERSTIEIATGSHSKFSHLHVQTKATGWSVSGQLRLLSDPLRHSNPGRVVLEAIALEERVLAASSAMIYRVVTANPRARLFGFRGALTGEFPTGAVLRIQHVSALP